MLDVYHNLTNSSKPLEGRHTLSVLLFLDAHHNLILTHLPLDGSHTLLFCCFCSDLDFSSSLLAMAASSAFCCLSFCMRSSLGLVCASSSSFLARCCKKNAFLLQFAQHDNTKNEFHIKFYKETSTILLLYY